MFIIYIGEGAKRAMFYLGLNSFLSTKANNKNVKIFNFVFKLYINIIFRLLI